MGLGDLVARLRIDSRQFDTSIRKSTTEIRNIQKQGKAINTGIAKVTGTITKMVPAIGAVTTASAAFARTIEVNQTLNDQWHRQIDGLKGALDSFFVSVSTFSFSNLIEGMKNAYADAKKLYDALDDLNTFSYFNEADIAELNAELQKQIRIVNEAKMVDQNGNPLHTETEVINAQNKALEIQNNILSKLDGKYNKINHVMFTYEDIVMNATGATREEAKTFLTTYGSTEQMKDAIKELDKQIKEAEKDTSSLSKYTIQYNGLGRQSVAVNDTEVDAMKKKRDAMQQLVELYGDDSKNSKAYNALRNQLAATYSEEERVRGQVNRSISRSVKGNEEFKQSVKDTNNELTEREQLVIEYIGLLKQVDRIQDRLVPEKEFKFNVKLESTLSKTPEEIRKELKDKLKEFKITPEIDIDKASMDELAAYTNKLEKEHIKIPVEYELSNQSGVKIDLSKVVKDIKKKLPSFDVEINPDKTALDNLREILKREKFKTDLDYEKAVKAFKYYVKQQFADAKIKPEIDIDKSSIQKIGYYIDEINNKEIVIDAKVMSDEQLKVKVDEIKTLRDELITTSGKNYYLKIDSNLPEFMNEFKQLGELNIQPIDITVNISEDEEEALERLNREFADQASLIEQLVAAGYTYKEILSELSFDKQIKELQQFASIGNSIADAFGKIGDAIGGAAGDWTSFIGKAINEVAQLVSVYAQLAYMTGISSAMALPPPQNLAMAAATIAALASIIASIPKFAEGGMVGGTSYTGDRILAGLNSGERVLTAKQNDKFENILENIGSFGGNVTFTIRGRDLQGTLDNNKNYNNTIKKQ